MMKIKVYYILVLFVFLAQNLIAQEIYKSDIYDFSVEAPKGWATLNHKIITDSARRSHGQKLITYYKNTANTAEQINPTITVFVMPNKFKNIDEFNRKMTLKRFDKNLSNYNVKHKPTLINVDEKHGAFELATYNINNQKNEYLKVKRKSYAFPTKDHIFYIQCIDERYSEENTSIFDMLIKSIKISKYKL